MLFKKKTDKRIDDVLRIIIEEYDRHSELMRVFMGAADKCESIANYNYNMELSYKERELMIMCGRIIDKINEEVLKD